MSASGFVKPLKRVSQGIADPQLARSVRLLEDKLEEVDLRLRELEKRVTDGGL